MKSLLLLTFLISMMNTRAGLVLSDTHIVVSDKESADVPDGKCRVVGTIFNGANKLSNGLVSSLDRNRNGVSDENGEYSFLLSDDDTAIFFFKEGYNEQVIWSYNFQSGHEVRIDFYAGNNEEIQIVSKPVIYLYSKEDLTATVSPNFKGDLSFTFPPINDAWNVGLSNNEIVNLNDRKIYPYLFWEGDITGLEFDKIDNSLSGSLINSLDIVPFLESNLSALGLVQKEISDFITFWGPKMIQKKYVFVQFLEDDKVDEKLGQLSIYPEPNNLKRVFLMFETFDENPHITCTAQTFTNFDRNGFTVIEWGGTEIKKSKIDL